MLCTIGKKKIEAAQKKCSFENDLRFFSISKRLIWKSKNANSLNYRYETLGLFKDKNIETKKSLRLITRRQNFMKLTCSF